ncbi:MAG: hypothetical protein WBS19_05805 [Candidatus Korobacteraceae bacterium]
MTTKVAMISKSDAVRQHAEEAYVRPARRKGEKLVSIQVGDVHRAVALQNRVPLVCQALQSNKFLEANKLRLVSRSGPRSGQSTTVTYTYEFVDEPSLESAGGDAWLKLRGALKSAFTELGGGEAYLRSERKAFHGIAPGLRGSK